MKAKLVDEDYIEEKRQTNDKKKNNSAVPKERVIAESPSCDIAKHITMIQKCAAETNLKGAFEVFRTLEQSGTDLNSVVYNTVLDACVECRDLEAAEAWMAQ